ncbi:MAG: nitroreductase family protein, partial [Nocardioides sp.]
MFSDSSSTWLDITAIEPDLDWLEAACGQLPSAPVDVDEAIRSRRTHKRYGATPVDEETLRELLDLARCAPNHKLTNPWRFRLLGPETRARIEAVAGEVEAAKLRRAPTLVLASAACSEDPVLA